jgi:hypothetical protein
LYVLLLLAAFEMEPKPDCMTSSAWIVEDILSRGLFKDSEFKYGLTAHCNKES